MPPMPRRNGMLAHYGYLPLLLGYLPACCLLHTSVFLQHCPLLTKCATFKGWVLFIFVHSQTPNSMNSAWHVFDDQWIFLEWMNKKKKSILWVSPLGLADAIWAMCLDADFETSIICGPVPCSANLGNWSVPLDYTLDSWAQHPEDIPFSTQGWQSKTGHTLEDWTSVFQKCKRNLPNPVHRRTLLTLC